MSASRFDDRPSPEDIAEDRVPALAFLELSSISRGLFLTDIVLKKAPVRVLASEPISSGKHALLFMGDVASVEESHRAALEQAEGTLLRQILIPGVHPQLAPFLDSLRAGEGRRRAASDSHAVGIVESASLAGAVVGADRALKTAAVSLCRMRLGQGIGGKAYFVLAGKLEDLEAAIESSRECLQGIESFCRADLIARPLEEALGFF